MPFPDSKSTAWEFFTDDYPDLGRETDISGVRVFPTARYPYLVYHSVRGDDLVIVHVRHARRNVPEEIQDLSR